LDERDFVRVSLDAGDPDTYKELKRIDAYWNSKIKALCNNNKVNMRFIKILLKKEKPIN